MEFGRATVKKLGVADLLTYFLPVNGHGRDDRRDIVSQDPVFVSFSIAGSDRTREWSITIQVDISPRHGMKQQTSDVIWVQGIRSDQQTLDQLLPDNDYTSSC